MRRVRRLVGFLLSVFVLLGATAAHAAVLCQKKSGAVFVRSTCKKKETALDSTALGLVCSPAPQCPPGFGSPGTCPPDAVLVGTTCVDKYEASVWDLHGNGTLLAKVRAGTVTLSDLTGGGATEVSPASGTSSPPFPASFDVTGNWTSPLYAVSVAGVRPTGSASWFQAEQACALSGKRLLTNQEWQGAAAGTPDPGTDNGTTDCSISAAHDFVNTGSRSSCVSKWGVFDMVGNVEEWVADWTDIANTVCIDWTSQTGIAGGDLSCFGNDTFSVSSHLPGALIRGGDFADGVSAGVFAVSAGSLPSESAFFIGFRCAR